MLDTLLLNRPISSVAVDFAFKKPAKAVNEDFASSFIDIANKELSLKIEVKKKRKDTGGDFLVHASDVAKKIFIHMSSAKIGISDRGSKESSEWLEKVALILARNYFKLLGSEHLEEVGWRLINRTSVDKKTFRIEDNFGIGIPATNTLKVAPDSFISGLQFFDRKSGANTKVVLSEDLVCPRCVDKDQTEMTLDIDTSVGVKAGSMNRDLEVALAECRKISNEYFIKLTTPKYREMSDKV